MIFKPFIKQLDFLNSRKIKLAVGLGPSKNLIGPFYITKNENVQFKKDPDIGSEILFLLKKGEVFSAERITPGAIFGNIEVQIDNNDYIKMEGWIDRSDLAELDLNSIKKDF